MDTESRQPKGRGGTLSSLNVAIEALGLAKEASSITPAKAVFGSVNILLIMSKLPACPITAACRSNKPSHYNRVSSRQHPLPEARLTRANDLRGWGW